MAKRTRRDVACPFLCVGTCLRIARKPVLTPAETATGDGQRPDRLPPPATASKRRGRGRQAPPGGRNREAASSGRRVVGVGWRGPPPRRSAAPSAPLLPPRPRRPCGRRSSASPAAARPGLPAPSCRPRSASGDELPPVIAAVAPFFLSVAVSGIY